MITTKRDLYNIIDTIDDKQLNLLCNLINRFLQGDEPSSDEIEAIEIGRMQFANKETTNHNDINWD